MKRKYQNMLKMSKVQFLLMEQEVSEVLEKEAIKKGTHTSPISEQPLPSGKKCRRKLPSDEFKNSQQIYSLRAFV